MIALNALWFMSTMLFEMAVMTFAYNGMKNHTYKSQRMQCLIYFMIVIMYRYFYEVTC